MKHLSIATVTVGIATLVVGEFSQSGGSLSNVTVVDTNLNLGVLDIQEYTAEHTPVPVAAGGCYWIEIMNGVGGDMDVMENATSWFWELSSDASTDPPFYRGNGRVIQDGQSDGLGPNILESAEDLEARDGMCHVRRDRVVRTNDGARLGRPTGPDRALVEHDDLAPVISGQIVGRAAADDSCTDDDDVRR